MLLVQYKDMRMNHIVELHKKAEGYCVVDGTQRYNLYDDNPEMTEEEVYEYFFDFENIWNIEKVLFVDKDLLEDILRSRLKNRNIYLEILENVGCTYIDADEYSMKEMSVVRDLGVVFSNDFYKIHRIEVLNLETGRPKKAYGYLGKIYNNDEKDSLIEIVYDSTDFNEEHLSEKIEHTKEEISIVKQHLRCESHDSKAKENLIQNEQKLIYLNESFLSELKESLIFNSVY